MFAMLLEQYAFQTWSWSIFNLKYSSRLLMVQDHKIIRTLWSWTIHNPKEFFQVKYAPEPHNIFKMHTAPGACLLLLLEQYAFQIWSCEHI